MKVAMENVGLLQMARFLIKISAFVLVSVGLLHFGKEWSDSDHQLLLLNYNQFTSNVTEFHQTVVFPASPFHNSSNNATVLVDFSAPQPKPVRLFVERFGIVDENGTMSNDFEVGDFDPEILEILRNRNGIDYLEKRTDDGDMHTTADVKRLPMSSLSMMDMRALDVCDSHLVIKL